MADTDVLSSEPVGSYSFSVPVLDRQPDPDDERWRVHEVTVDVSVVDRV